ncbi:hypothetical protein PMAC_000909 [Pneumocystis sp. 'macacae']|nr:hypothetical protein PMAC_000909 [Pneumocystis sp. 'macacae']
MGILNKGYYFLLGVIVSYIFFLFALTVPSVQRNVFYLHKLKKCAKGDVLYPESLGFSFRRVNPFFLKTSDNEDIFVWHILPHNVYYKYLSRLSEFEGDELQDFSTSLIAKNPRSKLIIYFHGTACNIAARHRLSMYRLLTSFDDVHVLALDYRGFGKSSGKPSENGLIEDGISVVKWAVEVADMNPSSIFLVGQSLGTAVVIGVAEKLLTLKNPIHVGHLILIAGFSSVRSLLTSYKLGGYFPFLSPLKMYPGIRKLVFKFLYHHWDSLHRIVTFSKNSEKVGTRITFIHSKDDTHIGFHHSLELFVAAVNATITQQNETWRDLVTFTERKGEVFITSNNGRQRIAYFQVLWGDHNQIVMHDRVISRLLEGSKFKKKKYLNLYKTVPEPKPRNLKDRLNNWKYAMAKIRRQYLIEYVSEQKRNDDLKKKMIEEKKRVLKTEKSYLSLDKNYGHFTPTIQSLFDSDYPLKDINKLDKINRKLHNFEMTKKKIYKDRLHHFLTLYSYSEKFISTIEELDDAVNKCFQEIPTGLPPSYNIQFLQNKKEKYDLKTACPVHSEIFDALLGTVDGGKLGPDELMNINNIHNIDKLDTEN